MSSSLRVQQAHFAEVPDGVEVTLRRAGSLETRTFKSWGEACHYLNVSTAWNGAPDPTNPPAGTPVVELKAA